MIEITLLNTGSRTLAVNGALSSERVGG